MQKHIVKYLGKLSAPELRVLLALLSIGRGRARTVTVRNADLKRIAAVDSESLPRARKGLVEKGLILTTKAGKEFFDYELVECAPEPAAPTQTASQVPLWDEEISITPIPQEVLFRTG